MTATELRAELAKQLKLASSERKKELAREDRKYWEGYERAILNVMWEDIKICAERTVEV